MQLEKFLEFLKRTFFVTCLGLCIWKVVESFIIFGEKDVGTKTELKYNHETDLPGFAVCRHPNQILSEVDSQGISLPNKFGLSLSDFRYLKAFEHLNGNILAIYQNFSFDDSKSVKNVVLSSRGQYSRATIRSLVSKPDLDKDNWSSFWHPLYGTCYTFQLNKPLVDVVGEAGIELVKVNLDFGKAFPGKGPEPEIIRPKLAHCSCQGTLWVQGLKGTIHFVETL